METERARLIDRVQVAQSQPSHLARVALQKRMYGEHPYAVQTPSIEDIKPLGTADLAALHAGPGAPGRGDAGDRRRHRRGRRAGPRRRQARRVERGRRRPSRCRRPRRSRADRSVLADRPGSVQTSMRLALPAVARTHPDHAALQLANLVFGGYFSSRWVENIREDKGYTYSPHSVVEHSAAGSAIILGAEVATDGDRGRPARDLVRAGAAGHHRARRGRAGAGPAVRARLAAARHVDPGRPGRARQHLRRVRPAAGLPGRARGPARPRPAGTRWPGWPPSTWPRPRRPPSCSATPTWWPTSLATLDAVELTSA